MANRSVFNYYSQRYFKENPDYIPEKGMKKNFSAGSKRRNFDGEDDIITKMAKALAKEYVALKYQNKADVNPELKQKLMDKEVESQQIMGLCTTAAKAIYEEHKDEIGSNSEKGVEIGIAQLRNEYKSRKQGSEQKLAMKDFSRRNYADPAQDKASAYLAEVCGQNLKADEKKYLLACCEGMACGNGDEAKVAEAVSKGKIKSMDAFEQAAVKAFDTNVKKLFKKYQAKNYSRRNGEQSGNVNFGLMNAIGSRINSVGQIERDYLKRYAERGYRWDKAWADYLKKFPDSQFWSDATAGVMFKQFLENIKDSLGTTWDVAKTAIVG